MLHLTQITQMHHLVAIDGAQRNPRTEEEPEAEDRDRQGEKQRSGPGTQAGKRGVDTRRRRSEPRREQQGGHQGAVPQEKPPIVMHTEGGGEAEVGLRRQRDELGCDLKQRHQDNGGEKRAARAKIPSRCHVSSWAAGPPPSRSCTRGQRRDDPSRTSGLACRSRTDANRWPPNASSIFPRSGRTRRRCTRAAETRGYRHTNSPTSSRCAWVSRPNHAADSPDGGRRTD